MLKMVCLLFFTLCFIRSQSPRETPSKTWLCIMKQQLLSELNMKSNEAFDVAKYENVLNTLIKDYNM